LEQTRLVAVAKQPANFIKACGIALSLRP